MLVLNSANIVARRSHAIGGALARVDPGGRRAG